LTKSLDKYLPKSAAKGPIYVENPYIMLSKELTKDSRSYFSKSWR